jgi:hypothetical protein
MNSPDFLTKNLNFGIVGIITSYLSCCETYNGLLCVSKFINETIKQTVPWLIRSLSIQMKIVDFFTYYANRNDPNILLKNGSFNDYTTFNVLLEERISIKEISQIIFAQTKIKEILDLMPISIYDKLANKLIISKAKKMKT